MRSKRYRFLVDECIGRRFHRLLEMKYDSMFVGDWRRGAEDIEVVLKAIDDDRIIITEDKDFGEIIFKYRLVPPGSILFRTKTTNPQRRLDLLEKALEGADPRGKVVVISEKATRVRPILTK